MQPGRPFRYLLVAGALLAAPGRAAAQTPVAPVADTARRAAVVADTTRPAAVGIVPDADAAEPAEAKLTRPLALRITAAIVVITLTTLLLYNVRSR